MENSTLEKKNVHRLIKSYLIPLPAPSPLCFYQWIVINQKQSLNNSIKEQMFLFMSVTLHNTVI